MLLYGDISVYTLVYINCKNHVKTAQNKVRKNHLLAV